MQLFCFVSNFQEQLEAIKQTKNKKNAFPSREFTPCQLFFCQKVFHKVKNVFIPPLRKTITQSKNKKKQLD